MAPVNTQTAAVIDPILSTHARGYSNQMFIGHVLFPRVTVPSRGMRVIRFGKEAFRMLNTRRAPGAEKKRIQYGYASDPISLVQDALEAFVPIEHQDEAMTVPGINLAAGALNTVLQSVDLGLENDIAQMARNAANYDANHKIALAGAARWTDPASDPEGDIEAGKEAIRRSIGRYPNVLICGPNAARALKRHPKVKEQFKYTSDRSITLAMLANFFELEKVEVGKAVYIPETAAENTLASDVWGDDAILAYVPTEGDNFQEPAYGYTYVLSGYPQVSRPYFENKTDAWIYPTKVERRPYLVGAEGGFLFQNAGTQ